MRQFALKLCLFLFLAAMLSGHTNGLATLTGAATGTILLWPIYRKLFKTAPPRVAQGQAVEEEANEIVSNKAAGMEITDEKAF